MIMRQSFRKVPQNFVYQGCSQHTNLKPTASADDTATRNLAVQLRPLVAELGRLIDSGQFMMMLCPKAAFASKGIARVWCALNVLQARLPTCLSRNPLLGHTYQGTLPSL